MVVKGNSEQQKIITITDLVDDEITKLSSKYWLHGNQVGQFDISIIEKIYHNELFNKDKKQENRIAILELSHYLENYLWPNFTQENSNFYQVFSIILMVNERVNEGLKAFEIFQSSEAKFKLLFEKILEVQDLFINSSNSNNNNNNNIQFTNEHIQHYIRFFINCFQNLEDKLVKNECIKICSYPIWLNLSKSRFQEELSNLQLLPLKKKIQILKKKESQSSPIEIRYQKFLYNLINYIIKYSSNDDKQQVNQQLIEIFLELLIDLMTLITTRRFFYSLLDDSQLILKIYMSTCNNSSNSNTVIRELLNQLNEYKLYQINNFTGEELTKEFSSSRYYVKIQNLQTIIFKDFQEIKNLSIVNFSKLENPIYLYENLSKLPLEKLQSLSSQLNLIDTTKKDLDEEKYQNDKEYLLNLIILNFSNITNLNWKNNNNNNNNNINGLRLSNQLPLYPTEKLLFNNELNNMLLNFNPKKTLTLPKLNLQYLSFNDYLSRNFYLTLLESSLDIKNLIEDSIKRLSPVFQDDSEQSLISFKGWSRMAVPINSFKMINVHKPLVGETKPKYVSSAISFQLDKIKHNSIIDEWNSIKEFDQLFLITLKNLKPNNNNNNNNYKISSVRGCQVIEYSSNTNDKVKILKVSLDTNQYQIDSDNNNLPIYKEFNVLLRMNPKESNFKAILDNIIELYDCKTMSKQLPEWLFSLFLGYPDPSIYNPTYKDKKLLNNPIYFNDTFLDFNHLKSSFQDKQLKFKVDDPSTLLPPFKITHLNDKEILVESYQYNSNSKIISKDNGKMNKIPFVPTQIKAIQSALLEGLTLIVGPPGTGKTDVAVQIISNIYHNHPTQKTLILTHSNQALNQIFEKIQNLNIHERYLLRLGHGTKQLSTSSDFSKSGRIDYCLTQRIQKLSQVEILAKSIDISTDVAYSCESALNFFSYTIVSKWEKFNSDLNENLTNEHLIENYPFKNYFSNYDNSNSISSSKSFKENRDIINKNWLEIEILFKELEEYQVFELLKSPNDRYNYLLLKQCKVVAMTCTHAVLKRNELIRLSFKFDNILMEESAQISDIECFLPIQLQKTEFSETNRLKRLIMIGDHNQLSPIVKNIALQKYSHFDQSLFTRFIRLQVPFTLLDQQGRCRSSLSELFKWRYQGLKDLDLIQKEPIFQLANPGFAYDYQLIDVTETDGYGQGEIEPHPHFYQNLGEAEYIASVYQYMRLLGYPSEKISVLTTYKGQKALLLNIFQEKCKNNPLFGMPLKITTVDKYQGQQNDYILLSLVRTKSFGHIRDVRRLIVAMSRARLGLYVFCKRQLYQTCYETISSLSHFLKRPDKLILTQNLDNEIYGGTRKLSDKIDSENQFEIQNSFHLQTLVNDNL